MRILDIAYTCPWPPRGGNDLRVWHLCRLMGRKAHQALLCRVMRIEQAGFYPAFRQEPLELHNIYVPRPSPWLRLAKALRYLPGPFPLHAAGFDFGTFRTRLRHLIRHGRYDVIALDGIWLASSCWPAIRASSALKVLNHFDIEALAMRRKAALFRDAWERRLYLFDARRMERLERRVMRSADLVWVTSETDRETILADNPGVPIDVAPNGVDCEAIRPLPPSGNRDGILFVGSMDQFANEDAVLDFVRRVLPLIRRRAPRAVFRIVGRHAGPQVLELGRQPGVEVVGEVADLAPWYAAAAVVVTPIRAGGGTRLKILEAMAYGRPVVSTTLGCEGIQARPGREVLLEDEPGPMAEAVLRLLERPDEAGALAEEARRLVENRYAWQTVADHMHGRYAALLEPAAGNRHSVLTQREDPVWVKGLN